MYNKVAIYAWEIFTLITWSHDKHDSEFPPRAQLYIIDIQYVFILFS
jgi:hypothetical protein